MVGTIVTPQNNTVSFAIPNELVGKKVKIIAYPIEEESSVIEDLVIEQIIEEDSVLIPEWQEKLVLAELKNVEGNANILKDWNVVVSDLRK
jgi:hypothetical protein